MSSQDSLQEELDSHEQAVRSLLGILDAQLIGQPQTTRQILKYLIAGGHALIEGAPGLSKTTLAKTWIWTSSASKSPRT